MDGITGSAIANAVAEFGILGLGWVLFLFMMFREIRERKRYTDLVIHIIEYFTKVNMIARHADETPPELDLLDSIGLSRRKSKARRYSRTTHDEGQEGE